MSLRAVLDWDVLAALPLRIQEVALERREQAVSSGFTRVTTVVVLRGGGEEGRGEDVGYDTEDHDLFLAQGPPAGLDGRGTLGAFAERLEALDGFPRPPARSSSRSYRRWAFESAALDLALRQAGLALHDALGLEPRPLVFVVSLRLGSPPSLDPLLQVLDRVPRTRFKLDPTSDWDDAFVRRLAELDVVDCLDFKGAYRGTPVDQPADPALYRRVAEAFPRAWLEDPALTAQTRPVLAPHMDRVTWDATLTSVDDLKTLEPRPRMINLKPSRFGSLRELAAVHAFCREHGVDAYGGGQFELGPGRDQIQILAALFHPESPNDTAPRAYHAPFGARGLPPSPLPPPRPRRGFRLEDRVD